VLIIREINFINTSSGLCEGACLVCRSGGTGIPDKHLHRMIHTRGCIDTNDSPDDEHWVA